jgi:hypothetical protein
VLRLVVVVAVLLLLWVRVAHAAQPSVKSSKAIIVSVAHATGYGKAQTDALLWIAKRESNYHAWSHSRSECHGLFQLSRGMAHGHPWRDPRWNTLRAIRYIRGRYGSPLRAKAHSVRYGWY